MSAQRFEVRFGLKNNITFLIEMCQDWACSTFFDEISIIKVVSAKKNRSFLPIIEKVPKCTVLGQNYFYS